MWYSCQTSVSKASRYPRRHPADSRLDPELSLAEQFNFLRVVDNRLNPASFQLGVGTFPFMSNLIELMWGLEPPNFFS